MIYLASPYSHPDPAVREDRFRAACRTVVAMMQANEVVYSPIVHGHPLVRYGLPSDWSFWQPSSRAFLMRCDAVAVVRLDGWQESVGVREEIRLAEALGKPLRFLEAPLSENPITPTVAAFAFEETR